MKTKAKQTESGKDLAVLLEETTVKFRPAYLLKGNVLQPLPAEHPVSDTLPERRFKSAKELEQMVLRNSKVLFGQQSFILNVPKKKGKEVQEQSPVFFMLDLGDPAKPRFYIMDIMLITQNFFGYLFLRVSKFLSYFNNEENIEAACKLLGNNKDLMKALLTRMNKGAIPEFLKNVVKSKPYVLLVTDFETKEVHEITETHPGWHNVKQLVFKKYASNRDTLCSVQPSFAEVHTNGKSKKEKVPVSEEYHLEDVTPEVLSIYKRIKSELLAVNNQLQFNPQKYYISLRKNRNLAFFHISRKKITLVVMNPEKDTRKQIKHFKIITLTEKVQRFWNGPSCSIAIDKNEHLKEVIDLLKKLVKA